MLNIFRSATTILLPCYLSYKALRLGDPAQTTPWLIYFIILSLSLLAESWTLFIVGWLPFYSWFRLFFLLYLVLPQTQGAKHLYLTYFEPWILDHERQIDDFIGQTHQSLERMGMGYMNVAIEWIREKILGQASPQSQNVAGAPAPGTAGYVNYASDLLSRFAMPAARTSAAPAVQAGASAGAAGVFGMLSSAAGAALGAATGPSASTNTLRAVPPSASQQGSPVPDTHTFLSNLSSMPSDQKSTYITSQRDRLTAMLKALDREQQSVDLAYGGTGVDNLTHPQSGRRPPSSHSGSGIGTGLFTKSRSEQSFDNIDYDDLHSGSGSGTGSGYPSTHSTPPHLRQQAASGRSSGGAPRAPSGGWLGSSPRIDDRDDYDRYDRDDLDVPRGSYRDSHGGRRSPRPGAEEDYYLNRGYTSARDVGDPTARSGRDYDREYR